MEAVRRPSAGGPQSWGHDSGSDTDANSSYPALELNYDALRHVARYYLPGDHGRCVKISSLGRGTYHEIRLLEFEDGWTCIARFTRDKLENLAVIESSVGTTEYVRKHTSLPVPRTYYHNFDPANPVGAPFLLIEHMPGCHLHKIWGSLGKVYKIAVVAQIADVIAQLAGLRFDKIGSLTMDETIGPLQTKSLPEHVPGKGPCGTTHDYMLSFLQDDPGRPAELLETYSSIRDQLTGYLQDNSGNDVLQGPFSLIHGDFDSQNIMFTWPNPDQPPQLSGIIDWDYSFTGPAYYLYEYPDFILDTDEEKEHWTQNKILRKEFVRHLALNFPRGSRDRLRVREAFRQKNYVVTGFHEIFTTQRFSPSHEVAIVDYYLKNLKAQRAGGKVEKPYSSRYDWGPDSEFESGDEGEPDGA